LTGCETNEVSLGIIRCTKCSATYHSIKNKCQAKVPPTGCDGDTNVVLKNNGDYCNKCKSNFYKYEGKCYAKTTLAGCDTNS